MKTQSNGSAKRLTTTTASDLLHMARDLKNFKIFAMDQLPAQVTNGSYIINTDDSDGPGRHWVALYSGTKQKYVVYFDPFGLPPPPRMTAFAKSGRKPAIASTTQIQDVASSACGYYCIDFLRDMNKGVSLGDFLAQWNALDQRENERHLKDEFKQ